MKIWELAVVALGSMGRYSILLAGLFLLAGCFGDDDDAPPIKTLVAVNDSYSTFGNTLLEVGVTPSGAIAVKLSGSVLDNDTHRDGLAFSISSVGTPTQGVVTMNADGEFSYMPTSGVSSINDSFTYEVTDGSLSSTATVNISITDRVWYVDNRNGAGTGLSSDPFAALADAGAVLQSGDIIYVANGDGTSFGMDSGLVISVAGVLLQGEGVALEFGGTTLVVAGTAPTISNLSGAGLTLNGASSTQVKGLNIADTSGDGVLVNDSSSVSLTSVSILRSGESAIQGEGANVDLLLTDVTIDTVDVTDPLISDDAIFIAATVSSSLVMSGGSISGVPASLGDGIEFENASADPVTMNLDIRGVSFFDIAQDAIKLDNDQGVMSVVIGGLGIAELNSLTNIGFRGIHIQTGDDSVLQRTNSITIQNNIISSVDEGIQIRSINDTTQLSILNNALDRVAGGSQKDLIDLQSEFDSNVEARVNDNSITNVSGSDGIKARVFDGASLTVEMLNNAIDGPVEGFDFDVIDGLNLPTTLNATVTSNTLSNIVNVALNARNADTTSTSCLDLVGNSTVADYELDALVGSFALTLGSQATVFNPAGGNIISTPTSCSVPNF